MSGDGERSRGVEDALATARAAGRFSGAACLVAIGGATVLELYLGDQAAWDPDDRPIAEEDRVPVDPSTLFDLASVTKVFSAHTALSVVDAGLADLDEPIADVLTGYREGNRAHVTLRHLLSHTSGLPAEWTGWLAPLRRRLDLSSQPSRFTESPLRDERDALIEDLLAVPLETRPGERFNYSCAGYNTAMVLLERMTGREWGDLTREFTSAPLGLSEVTPRPDVRRVAATEYQPQYRRGVVAGNVHDEAAWSLGGRSGNAGLFATGRDLLAFGEAIRRGEGRVRGEWMWDDALPAVLARPAGEHEGAFGSALGLRIGDRESMSVWSPSVRAQIGFTGTLLHIDRETDSTIVLLTNRVHPSRREDIVELRSEIVRAVLGDS